MLAYKSLALAAIAAYADAAVADPNHLGKYSISVLKAKVQTATTQKTLASPVGKFE